GPQVGPTRVVRALQSPHRGCTAAHQAGGAPAVRGGHWHRWAEVAGGGLRIRSAHWMLSSWTGIARLALGGLLFEKITCAVQEHGAVQGQGRGGFGSSPSIPGCAAGRDYGGRPVGSRTPHDTVDPRALPLARAPAPRARRGPPSRRPWSARPVPPRRARVRQG